MVERQLRSEDTGIDFELMSQQARHLLAGAYLHIVKIPD
jgi:hypothetical protein